MRTLINLISFFCKFSLLLVYSLKKNKDGGNLDALHKTISKLENENLLLKSDADYLKQETWEIEKKEQMLVENCVSELSKSFLIRVFRSCLKIVLIQVSANKKLETIQEELKYKTKESSQQQDEITHLFSQVNRCEKK